MAAADIITDLEVATDLTVVGVETGTTTGAETEVPGVLHLLTKNSKKQILVNITFQHTLLPYSYKFLRIFINFYAEQLKVVLSLIKMNFVGINFLILRFVNF